MPPAHASETRSRRILRGQTSAWPFGSEALAADSSAANASGYSTVRFWPSHATFCRVRHGRVGGMTRSMTAYV